MFLFKAGVSDLLLKWSVIICDIELQIADVHICVYAQLVRIRTTGVVPA